jgi:hypothetical protein
VKTLTEFDGFSLRNALAKKQELAASGKTADDLPQALGEALKVEGDRLTYLLAALEVIESKPENLKRVVVYNVDEGKQAPKGTIEKGGKHFLAEYFFIPSAKKERRTSAGPGKGSRGKKKGRGGRGRGPRREGSQGNRGSQKTDGAPKPAPTAAAEPKAEPQAASS